nr:MAG TPA: hypothetical protein [Caudoviricetes sp.]
MRSLAALGVCLLTPQRVIIQFYVLLSSHKMVRIFLI